MELSPEQLQRFKDIREKWSSVPFSTRWFDYTVGDLIFIVDKLLLQPPAPASSASVVPSATSIPSDTFEWREKMKDGSHWFRKDAPHE